MSNYLLVSLLLFFNSYSFAECYSYANTDKNNFTFIFNQEHGDLSENKQQVDILFTDSNSKELIVAKSKLICNENFPPQVCKPIMGPRDNDSGL